MRPVHTERLHEVVDISRHRSDFNRKVTLGPVFSLLWNRLCSFRHTLRARVPHDPAIARRSTSEMLKTSAWAQGIQAIGLVLTE